MEEENKDNLLMKRENEKRIRNERMNKQMKGER
jgi:hypothetical protein